jgi:hypothetical protein
MPLYATARNRTARFRVSGWDVVPPEWRSKPPSRRQRLRYFAILEVEVYQQKMASLAAGEDRHGAPLVDVRRPRSGVSDWHGRPYRRGSGPPLSPYRTESRVRNLMRSRHDSRSVTISWIPAPLRNPRPGGPRTFPELLVLHAEGRAGNGRKGGTTGIYRDVIGLPDARLLLAVERSVRRWRLKLGPRPLELPKTSRSGATRRQAGRPEPDSRRRRRVSTRLLGGPPDRVGLIQRIAGGVFGF